MTFSRVIFDLRGRFCQVTLVSMIEKKSVGKNAAYSLLSTLIQKGLTLLYFIVIAREFGPYDQGLYSAALAFTTLFGVLIDMGLSSALVRETARNPSRAQVYLGHMFVFRIVLSILVYALVIAFSAAAGYSSQLVSLIAISGIAMCIDVISTSCWAIMRGFQNLKYESIGGVLAIGVMITIGGVAVILKLPVSALVWAVVAGSVANLIYVLVLFVRRARVRLSLQWNWTVAREMALLTAPFALAALFSRMYTYSDSALLAKFAGEVYVGYYAAANKLILALNMIPAAVSSSIYPAMSSAFARGDEMISRTYTRAHTYLFFLALPMSVGTALLSKQIVAFFYGSTYAPTALTLTLLAPALLFGFLMFPAVAVLAATNKQHTNTVIFGVGALVNVMCNLALIPFFQSYGSAVAASFSSAAIFLMSFFAISALWKPHAKQLLSSFFKCVFSTVLMAAMLFTIRDSIPVTASIIVGIGIYGCAILFFGAVPHEDLKNFIHLIRRHSKSSV